MDWQAKQSEFWLRTLSAYVNGLEQRRGGVSLFSVEGVLIEQAMINLQRPTVWIDAPMSREALTFMRDYCACDVWEAIDE